MSAPARLILTLVILIGTAVSFVLPVEHGPASYESGQRIGYVFAVLAIPAVVAYLAAGRKKVRHPNRFALVFCCVAGFLILTNVAANLSSWVDLETPQQRFSRLMREAAGVEPEVAKGPPSQRKLDGEIREQYRALMKQDKEYRQTVEKTDLSKLKDINSAAAFADPERAMEGLKQLHDLYEIDSGEEQKVSAIMANLRTILERSAKSGSEKQEMLQAFDRSVDKEFSTRRKVLSAEKDWVDSMDQVHGYAQDHHNEIRLSQDHLVISDDATRSEFNRLLERQTKVRKDFIEIQAQLKQTQAEYQKKVGISPGSTPGR